MRAVLQRVTGGNVRIEEKEVASIGRGLVILLGIARGDTPQAAESLAKKTAALRIFEDENGKMNLSALDTSAEILLVSQFTLCADISRGRRPGFETAAPPEEAKKLCTEFADALRGQGLAVREGVFGGHMNVTILNDGPVTFVVDG